MVTIRDFRETDGEAVRAMMKSLATQRRESDHSLVLKDEYQRFFAGYMLGFLKNPDAVMKVAEDQGQVVGYVVATRGRDASYMRYANVAILSDVFVKESHRGKGLARLLIAAIEQWARSAKLQAIEVSVFPDHKQEMESLEGLGFFQYRIKMLRPLDEAAKAP